MANGKHQKIGLLGGSFNPAHEGHVHVSLEAIRRLQLDEVWWLVSPHNPLKEKSDLAAYEKRFEHACEITEAYKQITVSDFEAKHQLHYSVDTVAALQRRFRNTQFVWLMGADNLQIFHRWRNWQVFFKQIPIAVFDRSPFAYGALHSQAALHFKSKRLDENDAALLAGTAPPAWTFCFMPRHPLSATHLRKTLGKHAFDVR